MTLTLSGIKTVTLSTNTYSFRLNNFVIFKSSDCAVQYEQGK